MERELDIDECSDGLDVVVMLCVIEKVALAALVCDMPFEDVELGRGSGILAYSGTRLGRWRADFRKGPFTSPGWSSRVALRKI